MKKFLFSILFSILCLTSQSQVTTLQEGFENWPLNDWNIYLLGQALDGWREDFEGISHSGNHSAYSSIDNSQCDNWLVSPQINVESNTYELKFWDYHKTIDFYDKASVLISNGSGDPSDGDFVEVYTTPTPLNLEIWEERIIDLSSYNGQLIYVAFRYEGTWHQWYLDDVTVSPSTYTDGALTEIVNPVGVSETPGVEDIIVTLANQGTTTIQDIDIDWQVNSIAQPTFSATSLNLAPGNSIDLTIGNYNFDTDGNYDISALLSLANDFDSGNNLIEGTYTISSFKDIAILGVSPEGMIPNTGLRDIIVSVMNDGINTIDILTVDWIVNGSPQPSYDTTNLNLLPSESSEIVIGQYDFSSGVFEIEVSLDAIGDINSDNNDYTAIVAVDTFWESFEGNEFPPDNWSIVFGTHENGNFGTPFHGDYFYSSQPDSNFFGTVSDTIYTPRLDISNGDTFSFYIKTDSFFPATHNLVSKDPLTGAVTVLQNINSTPNVWQQVTLDISGAQGINHIGISSSSGAPGLTQFDLFTSTAKLHLYDHDMAIKNGDLYFLTRDGVSESFPCVIRNEGALPILGADYTIKLMEAPGVQLASISGVNLDSWEETTVVLNHTFNGIDSHRLYFEIEYTSDENLNNNSFREASVHVVPPAAILDEMGPKDPANLNFPFSSNGNTNSLGEDDISQTLYLNSDFENPGEIYGMVYSYYNLLGADYIQNLPIKIWIVQSQLGDLSGGYVPYNEFTLVYDGEMEVLPGYNREVYIPFDQPIPFTGIDNIVIQAYQYDPEWPPSILRFNATNVQSGPIRTNSNLDVFELDPENPPTPNQFDDFAHTRFVIIPSTSQSVVSGTVWGTGGIPLEDATVYIENTAITTQTDVNGEYELPALPYGNYDITATIFGYNDLTIPTTLNTPTRTLDFNLVERAQVEISGRVVGSNDIAVPLEYVEIEMTGYVNDNTSSDELGEFVFTNVYGNADYELTFSLYGYHDRTITVSVIDSNISLGDVVLDQEFISPFDVDVSASTEVTVNWKDHLLSSKVKLQNDLDVYSGSFTNEPNEHVWLGNIFEIFEITTLTDVEIRTDIYPNAVDFVSIDVFDVATEEILASSEPFLIMQDSLMNIDIPNIVVYDDIAVAVHWQNNPESTNALVIDYSDPAIPNTAIIKYPSEPITLLSDYIGTPAASFQVRINTLDDGDPITNNEILSYNVLRGLASEFPDTTNWEQLNGAPIIANSYVDEDYINTDPSQVYRYAVETIYVEGNSEVTFSNTIDGNILGIHDEWKEESLTLYPVPAREVLNIHFENMPGSITSIEITDVLGRFIENVPVDTSNDTIVKNVSNLQSGVYFLKIEVGEGSLTKRFVVSR
jgi:hypothetical protein